MLIDLPSIYHLPFIKKLWKQMFYGLKYEFKEKMASSDQALLYITYW